MATCKQGVCDTHKLLGRKAILPQGPWGRGKVPTAWLMRLTARPLSRVQHAVDRSALVPGSARPRSRSAPPDRFLRAPGVQVAGSDRRCQVATIEPGGGQPLPRSGGAVRAPRGDPPGTFPHGPCRAGRPYRSGHLTEFPVSPHLGREPRSRRSSGNTPGLQRFSRNKETDRQFPPCLVPEGERRTPGLQLGATEDKWSRSRF